MNLEERIEAFAKLGSFLHAIDNETREEIIRNARNENAWFTDKSINLAFDGIIQMLDPAKLRAWTSRYDLDPKQVRTVATVMAGNIPLVGFHDFLSVLIGGHQIQIKPSSKDLFLLKFLIRSLTGIEPRLAERITVVDMLKNFDAVIATGSDNSARYFEYYFSRYPHIIRKNRSSCAILTGFETNEEFATLGKDVFSYFGLGCRNVSKVFVPEQFDFAKLFKNWSAYEDVILHHKYHNNYDYQKSILLVNNEPHLDSGYLLLRESEGLVSPISVLFYEYYSTWDGLCSRLESEKEKLQCIVGNAKPATVKIGSAQSPEVWDYADQIDTLEFLEKLD